MPPPSSVLQKRKEAHHWRVKWNKTRAAWCLSCCPILLDDRGDKKAWIEQCVGCTLLIYVWKAKQDSVWDTHHLIYIWKVEQAAVLGAHHLTGFWNDAAGGRGHKHPPLYLQSFPSLFFLLAPPLPILFFLTPTYPLWCLSHGDVAFNRHLLLVMWPREVVVSVGDVA